MSEVFVISDLHLGHKSILQFEYDGKPLRPFADLDEMHETIVANWNATVRPGDKIYVLGDICFRKELMGMFDFLNGKKRLVRGNHDLFDTSLYLKYFSEIYGVRQINGVWLTHCPMHLGGVEQERVKVNIHGHLHANKIDHPKYFNASVECVNYTPISIEDVLANL